MVALPAGRHFAHGADGYEDARRSTVWNQRVPDRYPAMIVQAHDDDDVIAALAYAKAHDLQVGIRSGGHSWAANHLRDGGLLLDMHGFDRATIDKAKMLAVAGPGKGGSILAAELEEQDLFFPAGHCKGVCIGGYLLQGGYGWNSRVYGPACESVIGLDVITADGEALHRRRESSRSVLGGARCRSGVLRGRHGLSSEAVPEAGRLRHEPVRLSVRLRRGGVHLGA